MAKYRLNETEPRPDGSGEIAWQIQAVNDEGEALPSKHMTILTPAEDVAVALAGPQVGAKLIEVLKANLPEEGWDSDALDEAVEELILFKAANALAAAVDSDLDTFIGTAGGYPIDFDA